MKEDLIPVIILSVVTVYVIAHVLCLYYRSTRREERSRARERILRGRISDVKEQSRLLQEANTLRRVAEILRRGAYQGEESDEILSSEYVGDDRI